ncbi:MAG: epoxyqueuosine reductase QueH [Ruminiclostridium sp.]|nr:epoxyqueuosine reductase QueH [Ruminiclostridium sp.]
MSAPDINYGKALEKKLRELRESGITPTLLLHCCCAPCSSAVLEYLTAAFRITVFFFNPNISEREEYEKRANELKRLLEMQPAKNPVTYTEGAYAPERFYEAVKGYEHIGEGGERCFRCYRLRIAEAADMAKQGNFDYFTTTLSISPLKNAKKLNEIGAEESRRVGIPYLYSDFKKNEGYKRSIVLSKEYGLYRQNFCGCKFSRAEREG